MISSVRSRVAFNQTSTKSDSAAVGERFASRSILRASPTIDADHKAQRPPDGGKQQGMQITTGFKPMVSDPNYAGTGKPTHYRSTRRKLGRIGGFSRPPLRHRQRGLRSSVRVIGRVLWHVGYCGQSGTPLGFWELFGMVTRGGRLLPLTPGYGLKPLWGFWISRLRQEAV